MVLVKNHANVKIGQLVETREKLATLRSSFGGTPLVKTTLPQFRGVQTEIFKEGFW